MRIRTPTRRVAESFSREQTARLTLWCFRLARPACAVALKRTRAMREILPGLLSVGNAFDARDLKSVLTHRIHAIIDLAMEEPPIAVTRELIYCRFPLIDGQGNSPVVIEAAIRTALLLVSAKVPSLVSCGGGMSRSPAIAAAVVARTAQISPDEAMKKIAASGPHDVSPGLWQEVKHVLAAAKDW